jgi:predicted transcriptional regulator
VRSRRNWSDRDSVKLHKILKENPYLLVNEICEKLDRSKITIQHKLRKFGYKKGYIRDER